MTEPEFVVPEFRPVRKGASLQGFFPLILPSGLVLGECSYHRRDGGARWIGMPSRQFTKHDGEVMWIRLVDFVDRAASDRFQKLAIAGLDRYLEAHPPRDEEDAPAVMTPSALLKGGVDDGSGQGIHPAIPQRTAPERTCG